jgi:hypothetical protein
VAKLSGKDIDSFRQLHDKNFKVPRQIKAALAELGDAWEYEGEFIKRCGVSVTDFAHFRDQFSDHWLEAKTTSRNTKRVWCGTKKFADKLREFSS